MGIMSILDIKTQLDKLKEIKSTETTETIRTTENAETANYTDDELREIGKEYCSHGDKVYADPVPKVFKDCNGVFMYDSEDTPYLDLEMWFASCNLGYKNQRIRDAVVNQIDTLPQISSQFLSISRLLGLWATFLLTISIST